MDTCVEYLGLKISSPIVAGSCSLTMDIDKLRKLEDAGVGAIVLKSIFEEQIIYDIKKNTHVLTPIGNYGKSYEYVEKHVKEDALEKYFEHIRQAKEQIKVPIIGSINCYTHENWITYAKKFVDAGCDALELNIDILPYETSLSCDDVDRTFGDIVRTLRKVADIPVGIKVGHYFTDMAKFMQQLSWMGVQGITIFNKAPHLDIDLENETLKEASFLSAPEELGDTLMWVSVLKNKLRCDITASTGVYTADDVVKLILAGASAVQVVSCLYKNGVEYVKDLNDGLKAWMQKRGYEHVDDFKGKLAMKKNEITSMMRTIYMKEMGGL